MENIVFQAVSLFIFYFLYFIILVSTGESETVKMDKVR